MAEISHPLLLLLTIVCVTSSTSGAETSVSSRGLNDACKKISNTKFCLKLLQPYASEFEDNDPHKMGHAAISATLSRAQAARAFMVRQITDPEMPSAQQADLKQCLDKIGNSVDSLRQAAREFNNMKEVKGEDRANLKKIVVDRVISSSIDQNDCYNLLNRDGNSIAGDIIQEVKQEAEEAAKASLVAQFFVN